MTVLVDPPPRGSAAKRSASTATARPQAEPGRADPRRPRQRQAWPCQQRHRQSGRHRPRPASKDNARPGAARRGHRQTRRHRFPEARRAADHRRQGRRAHGAGHQGAGAQPPCPPTARGDVDRARPRRGGVHRAVRDRADAEHRHAPGAAATDRPGSPGGRAAPGQRRLKHHHVRCPSGCAAWAWR